MTRTKNLEDTSDRVWSHLNVGCVPPLERPGAGRVDASMWRLFKIKDPKVMIPYHVMWILWPMSTWTRASPLVFLFGLIYANFMEFANHKWNFHAFPHWVTGTKDSRFYYVMHGHHHKYPHKNPVTPLPQTSALYLLSALLFRACLPATWRSALAGGASGFLAFELTHIFIHAAERDERAIECLKPLVEFHLTHHSDPTVAYGFTSPFWDWLFGYLPKPSRYDWDIVPIPLPWVSFFLSKAIHQLTHY